MLSNQIVLITGGGKGIGAACAKLLAKNGAKIVVNYNSDDKSANDIVASIKENGGEAFSVKADVSEDSEVEKMFSLINDRYGTVDVLINNASNPVVQKKFSDLDQEDFSLSYNIIFGGALKCCKAVLPSMVKKKKGKIINMLTIYTNGNPPQSVSHYVSAKYALMGLSKCLAIEYGPLGINVNMVSPGLTNTDMTKDLPDTLKMIYSKQTPLRRVAEPNDIASVILFLCSKESDYLTGVNIPVCGGYNIY